MNEGCKVKGGYCGEYKESAEVDGSLPLILIIIIILIIKMLRVVGFHSLDEKITQTSNQS